jgi:hypothetical protein
MAYLEGMVSTTLSRCSDALMWKKYKQTHRNPKGGQHGVWRVARSTRSLGVEKIEGLDEPLDLACQSKHEWARIARHWRGAVKEEIKGGEGGTIGEPQTDFWVSMERLPASATSLPSRYGWA